MSLLAFSLLAPILSTVLVLATPAPYYANDSRVHVPRQGPCIYNCPATAIDGTVLSFASEIPTLVPGDIICAYGDDLGNSPPGSVECAYFIDTGGVDLSQCDSRGLCRPQADDICTCQYLCPPVDLSGGGLGYWEIHTDGYSYNGELYCNYFDGSTCIYSPTTGVLDPAYTVGTLCLPEALNSCSTNASLTCGDTELQCCGTLALSGEPAIANALGLEGLPIPLTSVTVGLNCSSLVADGEPVSSSCLGIISCCDSIGLGTDASIAEGCVDAGISSSSSPISRDEGFLSKLKSRFGIGKAASSASAWRKQLSAPDYLRGRLT